MVQGTLHREIIRVVAMMLQQHFEYRIGPHVAGIPHVEDPKRPRDSLDETKKRFATPVAPTRRFGYNRSPRSDANTR